MTRNIRSTDLYRSLTADWRRQCRTRAWRREVQQLLTTAPNPAVSGLTPEAVIELVEELGGSGKSRYLAASKRRAIGGIVDEAASNRAAMQISLRAVFASVDCYWWPLKFGDHEPEPALAELMMFAFIELSDASKVGPHRHDPLACVRTNATNRAVSALNTQRRRHHNSDLLPFDVLETSSDAERLVDEPQQSLKLMTQDIMAASGQPASSVASFVLHNAFGLSFQDLSLASSQSKATHHRRSHSVELALRTAAA